MRILLSKQKKPSVKYSPKIVTYLTPVSVTIPFSRFICNVRSRWNYHRCRRRHCYYCGQWNSICYVTIRLHALGTSCARNKSNHEQKNDYVTFNFIKIILVKWLMLYHGNFIFLFNFFFQILLTHMWIINMIGLIKFNKI